MSFTSWIPENFQESDITLPWLLEMFSRGDSAFMRDVEAAINYALKTKDDKYRALQRELSVRLVKSQLDVVGTLCKYGERKGILYYVQDDGTLGTFDTTKVDLATMAQVLNNRTYTDANPQRNMLYHTKGINPSTGTYTEDDVRVLNVVEQCSAYSKDWLSSVERSDLEELAGTTKKKQGKAMEVDGDEIVILDVLIPLLLQWDMKDTETPMWNKIRDRQADDFFDAFNDSEELQKLFPKVQPGNENQIVELWLGLWDKYVYKFYKVLSDKSGQKNFQDYITESGADPNEILKEIQTKYGEQQGATLAERVERMAGAFAKLVGTSEATGPKLKTREAQMMKLGLDHVAGLMGNIAKDKGVKPLGEKELLEKDKGIYHGSEVFDKVKSANRDFFMGLNENERIVAIRAKIIEALHVPFVRKQAMLIRALNDLANLGGREEIANGIARLCVAFFNNPAMYSKQYITFTLTGGPGTGKTELANRIAAVLASLGVLIDGSVTVTSRASLVGQHIGETADKVNNVLKGNLENVLFIDEAYSVAQGSPGSSAKFDPYGIEALNELTGFLDKNKGIIAVIVAGYKCEMEEFFYGANPGLRRRFKYQFELMPYTPLQLMQILAKFLRFAELSPDQIMTDPAQYLLARFITEQLRGNDANPHIYDAQLVQLNRILARLNGVDDEAQKQQRKDIEQQIVQLSSGNILFSQAPAGQYIFRRMMQNEAGDMENLSAALAETYNGNNKRKLGPADVLVALMDLVFPRDGRVEVRTMARVDAVLGTCTAPKYPAIFTGMTLEAAQQFVYGRLNSPDLNADTLLKQLKQSTVPQLLSVPQYDEDELSSENTDTEDDNRGSNTRKQKQLPPPMEMFPPTVAVAPQPRSRVAQAPAAPPSLNNNNLPEVPEPRSTRSRKPVAVAIPTTIPVEEKSTRRSTRRK